MKTTTNIKSELAKQAKEVMEIANKLMVQEEVPADWAKIYGFAARVSDYFSNEFTVVNGHDLKVQAEEIQVKALWLGFSNPGKSSSQKEWHAVYTLAEDVEDNFED